MSEIRQKHMATEALVRVSSEARYRIWLLLSGRAEFLHYFRLYKNQSPLSTVTLSLPSFKAMTTGDTSSHSLSGMNDSNEATSSKQSHPTTTRKRKAYSCTECRRRKKQCDRQVPGCSQCRSRGESHLCRWGDERDEETQISPPARKPRIASAPEAHDHSFSIGPSPAAEADESAVRVKRVKV